MAGASVRRTLLILGSAIVGPLAATSGAADRAQDRQPEAPFVRVRSSTTLLLEVMRDGHARSPTFRRLVARLEREAALVYVEPGRCRPNNPEQMTGCLAFLGRSGGLHHFRITVDVGAPRNRLIATVGHELQHAVEVMESGISRADEAARLGTEVRPGVYETEEAQRISRAILAELGATRNR
jgi:hypothetical protein